MYARRDGGWVGEVESVLPRTGVGGGRKRTPAYRWGGGGGGGRREGEAFTKKNYAHIPKLIYFIYLFNLFILLIYLIYLFYLFMLFNLFMLFIYLFYFTYLCYLFILLMFYLTILFIIQQLMRWGYVRTYFLDAPIDRKIFLIKTIGCFGHTWKIGIL